MSWPLVRIGQVTEVNPRLPKETDETQLVSFLGMASVSEDGKLISEEARVLSETKKGFTYFTDKDVLLAKITPCFENGKCLYASQIQNPIGYGSTEFHVIRASPEELDSKYLFYMVWSNNFRFYGEHAMFGAAGQRRVSADFIRGYEIPLPPLKEQKRIAAILDKADAILRKRKQAITLADEFLRSLFLDMFGDIITSKESLVSFGEVVKIDAKMVDPREADYLDFVHIGPDRISKESGKLLPALTAREEGLISKKFLYDERYVLYSKIRPYLRKCALAVGTGLCSADMYPIRAISGVTTREFLWMLLLSNFFTNYTETLPDRASIPKLNRNELKSFSFSLPSLDLQKEFSKIVVKAVNLNSKSIKALRQSEIAFNALSQKAFSGQLSGAAITKAEQLTQQDMEADCPKA